MPRVVPDLDMYEIDALIHGIEIKRKICLILGCGAVQALCFMKKILPIIGILGVISGKGEVGSGTVLEEIDIYNRPGIAVVPTIISLVHPDYRWKRVVMYRYHGIVDILESAIEHSYIYQILSLIQPGAVDLPLIIDLVNGHVEDILPFALITYAILGPCEHGAIAAVRKEGSKGIVPNHFLIGLGIVEEHLIHMYYRPFKVHLDGHLLVKDLRDVNKIIGPEVHIVQTFVEK